MACCGRWSGNRWGARGAGPRVARRIRAHARPQSTAPRPSACRATPTAPWTRSLTTRPSPRPWKRPSRRPRTPWCAPAGGLRHWGAPCAADTGPPLPAGLSLLAGPAPCRPRTQRGRRRVLLVCLQAIRAILDAARERSFLTNYTPGARVGAPAHVPAPDPGPAAVHRRFTHRLQTMVPVTERGLGRRVHHPDRRGRHPSPCPLPPTNAPASPPAPRPRLGVQAPASTSRA